MSKRTANRAWLTGLVSVACLTAITGALSLGYAFDFSIGQFSSRSPLWILTLILGGLAVLGAICYPIFAIRRENYSVEYKISPFMDFAALFAASMLILDAISTFLRNRGSGEILPQAKAALAVLASLFFIVLFIHRALGTSTLTALAAISTLWATFEAFYAYFDPAFPMVSPFRTYPQLPCVALALFLFCETKLSAKSGKPLMLILAAALSGVFSVSVGGATVIAYLFSLNRVGIPVTDGLWMIALGIYAFARVGQSVFSKKNKQRKKLT
ncbi:MAG: hypothetical protein IJY12_01180 [Clostridia bacterium]|nr:hypothetical protein [Clostridia bacterium]